MGESDRRADALLEQVIELEEEAEMLRHENTALKTHVKDRSEQIINTVIGVLSERIEHSTRAITAAVAGRGSEATEVAAVKESAAGVLSLFYELEEELKGLCAFFWSLCEQMEEKDKQIEVYAALNARLTKIKDEYVRMRQGGGGAGAGGYE